MPTRCITIDLPKQGRRKVRAGFDGGRMSSDGGALLLWDGWAGGVSAKRLVTDRSANSVPEPVQLRGRAGYTRALPHDQAGNQLRAPSRQPTFRIQDAKIRSSPKLVTDAG